MILPMTFRVLYFTVRMVSEMKVIRIASFMSLYVVATQVMYILEVLLLAYSSQLSFVIGVLDIASNIT